MSDDEQLSERARKRAAAKARRAKLVQRREDFFGLLMSGYSVQQIAKTLSMSRFAVRRVIEQALAERAFDTQEDFAKLQVARLNKALRCADVSLEKGDMRAIPHFIKVVAELDRYHGLAPQARQGEAARRADESRLAAPPLKLTHAPAAPAAQPAPAAEMCAKAHLSP